MQTSSDNTLLQISIPNHRQDIIKVFKDLVEVFRGDIKVKEKSTKKTSDEVMDKYIGKFSGDFKDLTGKEMFYRRANKL